MRRIIVALVLVLAVSGCNTIEGLGEDIASGARATSEMLN